MSNRFDKRKENAGMAKEFLTAGKLEETQNEEVKEQKEEKAEEIEVKPTGSFLDEVVLEKVQKVESKPKSFYLEKDVIMGIKKLAKRANKTESQFVNDILKQIVQRYL